MPLLLVEDNARIAATLVRGLGEDGFQVEHLGDGESALARLDRGDVDAVVLDLGLPDLDGLEIALRRPRTPEEWQGSAQTSLDEVRRLGRLVDALLRLARSEAGAPRDGVRVELAQLCEQVVAQHAATAAPTGVALRSRLAARASVVADPDELGAALANLVANALRYTPRGGAVSVGLEASEPGRVAILVDDDGPGVPEHEREAIFAPFARGEAGLGAGDAGFGLGLAIARRVATRWGGTLHTEARPEGGARFVLALPA